MLVCFIGRAWELVGAPSLGALVHPGADHAGPGGRSAEPQGQADATDRSS